MNATDFVADMDSQLSSVLNEEFEVEIIDTNLVPDFNDSSITFDNVNSNKKKCKRLESCVLFVDIRNSVALNVKMNSGALAKIYSTFIGAMISCANNYGGHVRNIIGDRVMVVFDAEDCFKKALDTAVLMNAVCRHILNKRILNFDFKCGIGIDYGQMLISKGGVIKQGTTKEFYRGLVWLGKPANIASRLTDIANRNESITRQGVGEGARSIISSGLVWNDRSYEEFIDNLEPTYSQAIKHKNPLFSTFIKKTLKPETKSHPPILMTRDVYIGLKKSHPDCDYIKKAYIKRKPVKVRNYTGPIFGTSVDYRFVRDI